MGLLNFIGGTLKALWSKMTGFAMTPAEEQAHQYNVEETMREEKHAEDMYLKYESPAAQVRQYKEAGLNPSLLAGTGVSGPQAVSGASDAHTNTGGLDPLGAIMNLLGGIQNIKDAKLSRELATNEDKRKEALNTANIEYLQSLTTGKNLDNSHSEDIFNLDKQERTARIQSLFAGIDKQKADTKLAEVHTNLAELQQDYQRFTNALAEIDLKNRQKVVDASLRLYDAQRLLYQYEAELSQLRVEYEKEDRPDKKALLRSQVESAEAEADYMKKRKEHHDEILEAEIKSLQGEARYNMHRYGLDLAGKVTSGLGILGGLGLGAIKLFGSVASKAVPIVGIPSLWETQSGLPNFPIDPRG